MNNEQLLHETQELRKALVAIDRRLEENLTLSEETHRLSVANEERTTETQELAKVNKKLVRSNRRLVKWAIGLSVVCLLCAIGTGALAVSNWRNAKVQCLNANESRKAQLAVWDFVLGWELADSSEAQAPAETEMSRIILPYMHKIWAQRDCDNLDKEYDLPPAPTPPPPAERS